MDDTKSSNENKEDSHDSDIESRLYAQVYYSNTIIGDEINSRISNSNNELPDKEIYSNRSKTSSSLTLAENINDPVTNSHHVIQNATASYFERQLDKAVADGEYSTINSAGQALNVEISAISKSKHSYIIQDANNSKQLNQNPPSVNDINNSELNQVNKKRKISNISDHVNETEMQKNTLNVLDDSVNSPSTCQKNNKNTIINPYSKQVTSNSRKGLALLSPEFINLLFGKSTKKTTYAQRRKLQKNKSKKKSHSTNISPGSKGNEFLISHTPENDREHNKDNEHDSIPPYLSNASEIIDISSESSEEDNSKYTTITTDKKLYMKESEFDDVDSESSMSDSEESIFEVPVPPKPAPPLIELKDSDKESTCESDSSSCSIDSHPENVNEELVNTLSNTDIASNNTFQNAESESLILNCTEIQKGAASLNEIKKMSQPHLNIKESTNDASTSELNMYNVENVQNIQSQSNNVAVNKKDVIKERITSNSSIGGNKSHNQQNDSLKENYFSPMSKRMKSFYNDSWGGENFDLDKLKSQMSTDPNKWAILEDDLVISFSRRKRYFGMVCNRCQKDGHRQNQCPEPFKNPVCHMCGEQGHLEMKCPNKICLTCGKKQKMYRQTCENCQKLFCSRCKSRGHLSYSCPDLWRRYHHTINNINIGVKVLKTNLKPNSALFCCNCAKKGHDSFQCRKFRWSQHFPNPPQIINYNGPTYDNEDFDSSSHINNSQEKSFNSNTCDSSNFAMIYNDPKNSNELDQAVHSTRYTNSNQIENNHNYLKDNSQESFCKVIFRIMSRAIFDAKILESTILNLNVPEEHDSSNFENWRGLWSFLNALVSDMPFHFLLIYKDNHIQMDIRCPKKNTNDILKIVNLYAERTNYERSLMYLNSDRSQMAVVEHLSTKFDEMRNLCVDPLELHNKIIQLNRELSHRDQAINDLEISSKVEQLTYYKQKLLLALYTEGCVDESLQVLKKIYCKLQKRIRFKRNTMAASQSAVSISFRYLCRYLYHYNQVFVAHEFKHLIKSINKYKNYIGIRKNLINNPVLQHPVHNMTELSSTCQTSSILPSSNVNISPIPSLLSQNIPIMTESQKVCNITNINSLNDTIQYIPLKKKKKSKNLSRQPNKLYLLSTSSDNEKRRKYFEKLFRDFVDNTKHLLSKARKLNTPKLRSEIKILQKKMKNETYLQRGDVKTLKMLVKNELRKQKNNQ